MNLRDLKAAVYAAAPELASVFSDDVLERLFNECQRQLAFDTRELASATVSVVGGKFVIPASCLVLREVTWEGRRLAPWFGGVLPQAQTGTPAYYFLLDGYVHLTPQADGEAVVYYTPKPADMQQDSDEPSVRNADEVLIAYALWNGFRTIGDVNSAALWERTYTERKQAWWMTDRSVNYRVARVRNVLAWW